MRLLALVLCVSLAGCSSGSDSAKDEDKESVFDPLVDNIDKAKEVENQIMEQKQQLDQAIRDAEAEADGAEDESGS